ncbi:P-loop containing nucleoside triphosphate hydrolase protein [Cercophora scortea]|uniref:P-loop containing nucleoside triphosphate hydrolase protein n=1 Tax=Cercophora scortea TaxID=314031 RepID=A0AAE0J362_9PEZI|nr:P-loop containing nucleoside triphosphate hydrolase protein [Cercophora scortea]
MVSTPGLAVAAASAAAKAASTLTSAAAAAAASASASRPASIFQPRQIFEASDDIPRAYFLGHHHAALSHMQRILSYSGLIIECRDFRIPLSSWNPLLEHALGRTARIIVYTKRDLGPLSSDKNPGRGQSSEEVMQALTAFHKQAGHAKDVLFIGKGRHEAEGTKRLLEAIKKVAVEADNLTGLRCMVVGMPNAGKSTVLNRLRAEGMGLGKAARTGVDPGVTRKLGTPVRIMPGELHAERKYEGLGEGVFLLDTPGVFKPYVARAEDMIKMALVGCIKTEVVPSTVLADYLLYQLNLVDPGLYKDYCREPTNDVHEFLSGVGTRLGKIKKGNQVDIGICANRIIQEYRRGGLGRFFMDSVTPETFAAAVQAAKDPELSLRQSRKAEKEEARKMKYAAKKAAAAQVEP